MIVDNLSHTRYDKSCHLATSDRNQHKRIHQRPGVGSPRVRLWTYRCAGLQIGTDSRRTQWAIIWARAGDFNVCTSLSDRCDLGASLECATVSCYSSVPVTRCPAEPASNSIVCDRNRGRARKMPLLPGTRRPVMVVAFSP